MHLENRVALITGGRRIGSAIALELARHGVDVALSYNRSKAEVEETAAAIQMLGRRSFVRSADLRDSKSCEVLVAETATNLGRLDILINMASLYQARPFDELTEADWDANIDLDLKSAFLCTKAALPAMRAQGGGRIINFSDWVAASGRPRYKGYVAYYVAKMGLIALTQALALELAEDNILVNAIAPGPILAPPTITAEEHQSIADATPLGRWGGPNEIVKVVLALLDTDFVTGETIRVDGGRHVR